MVALIAPSLFSVQAESTYSFRGRTFPNYSSAKSSVYSSYSSFRLGSRANQSSRIQKADTSSSSSSSSVFRSQGRSTSTIRAEDKVQRVITSPQTDMREFTANSIPFTITLPTGFEKESDSLDWESGSISFRSEDSTVTLHATGELCEGSLFQARLCLSKLYQDRMTELTAKYPNAFVLKNETVELRSQANRTFDKKNLGRFLILKLGNTRIGNFTFFDPVNEFVWNLEIQAPDNSQKILNSNRLWTQIFESLFRQEDTRTRVQRNVVSYADRRSSVTLRSNNIATEGYRNYTTFRAENVPFSLAVPEGFLVTEDTLATDSGKLHISGLRDGWVTVEATPGICDSQTSRIVRRCIEEAAEAFKEDLITQYPKLSIVRDENTLLSLKTTQYRESEVARIIQMRGDGDRVFQMTFRDPMVKNVWVLRASSPDEKDAFLYDASKLQNLIQSVQFHDGM